MNKKTSQIEEGAHFFPRPRAFVFDEFFDSGMEESVSPFLTVTSRKFGKNLSLKGAFLAAGCLCCSFLFSFSSINVATLFLLLTYFLAGIPSLIDAVEDLLKFEINIDVLMTLAAFGAILIGSGTEGALLLVLFALSGAMEDAVRGKAKGRLGALKKVMPQTAYVVTVEGKATARSVKEVKIGDLLLVRAGEIVPLDAVIVAGRSSVNLVHLTGESTPLFKKEGEVLPSGARNLEGALTVKVTRRSADSTLARIIKLATEAAEAKPSLQKWFDRLSSTYAITIISCAALFALLLPFLIALPFLGSEGSIYRALAFLIAASPCALIIAVPIAYLSAVSVVASKGIVVKGAVMLDALGGCTTLAFDKTGTLTEATLELLGIEGEGDTEKALAVAAALERNAVHPIAAAILAKAENTPLPLLTHFVSHPGLGIEGEYEGKRVYIGNEAYLLGKVGVRQECKTWLTSKIQEAAQRGEGYAILLLGEEVFLFRFRDTVRKEAKETLRALQERYGLHLVMLTGDHERSAQSVAQEVGIKTVFANLRPEDKLRKIEELAKKEKLAMVGDGINDAPALARAHVGISMGKGGSQTAIDASDIVFLQDDLEKLPWLIDKARCTKRIVRENLCFALLAIVCASIPALMGWLPLWAAVVAHEGGTVLVGLNALRLLSR